MKKCAQQRQIFLKFACNNMDTIATAQAIYQPWNYSEIIKFFFGSKLNNLMLLVQYGVFCTFFILNIIENSHGIQHTMLQNPKNPRSPISANKLNSNFLKMTRANVFQTLCTHMIWSKLLIPIILQKFVLQISPTKTSFFNILFF